MSAGTFTPELARLGDSITTDLRLPYPHKLTARLDTPDAVAYANHILMTDPGVWRVVKSAKDSASEGRA